ncbi:MAG: gene transfer agent family protein [Xanthobacteraceae bacterium]
MSRDASITLDWADGTFPFRLAWGELEKLQEACDAGPYVILNRLVDNSWRVGDISNVIRLGLLGGGMTPVEALTKTREYVEKRPPVENLMTAQAILSAGLVGAPEEKLKKKVARRTRSKNSRTGKSGSPRSTATVQP